MENQTTLQFVLTTLMELGTMAAAYLGLRLFRHNQWLRLAIIVAPLLVNTLLGINNILMDMKKWYVKEKSRSK